LARPYEVREHALKLPTMTAFAGLADRRWSRRCVIGRHQDVELAYSPAGSACAVPTVDTLGRSPHEAGRFDRSVDQGGDVKQVGLGVAELAPTRDAAVSKDCTPQTIDPADPITPHTAAARSRSL